jgi:tRNA(fMet)-specific endonuclease VapC
MQFLLDTNTCIAAMRANKKVVSRLAAISPTACAISTITIYELYTGVEKCAAPTNERVKVDMIVQTYPDLHFDGMAASQAAWLRAYLESRGQPIGPYDTLLAGQALVLGLTLVTANVKEFGRVPSLNVENWEN